MRKLTFFITMFWRMFRLSVLKQKVRFKFHMIDGRWYVDYPEYPFSHANLEMVAGADKFCMALSDGKKQVEVYLSLKDITRTVDLGAIFLLPGMISSQVSDSDYKLTLNNPNEAYGRVYTVHKKQKGEFIEKYPIWLCPVMRYTFGNYPQEIFVKRITQ